MESIEASITFISAKQVVVLISNSSFKIIFLSCRQFCYFLPPESLVVLNNNNNDINNNSVAEKYVSAMIMSA